MARIERAERPAERDGSFPPAEIVWLSRVLADGTLRPLFREVGPDSPPLLGGPEAQPLTDYCFRLNRTKPGNDAFLGDCACGAAR